MVFFNDTHFQNPSCILAQIVCYLQWGQKLDAFGIRQLILSLIQWFWNSFHFQSNYAELLMLLIMNRFQLYTENKCVCMCFWVCVHVCVTAFSQSPVTCHQALVSGVIFFNICTNIRAPSYCVAFPSFESWRN